MRVQKLAATAAACLAVLGAWGAFPNEAIASACPSVADPKGIKTQFPQQAELGELERQLGRKIALAENPMFATRV